jgi:lysyl-tRNA synthetase class 2
VIGRVLDAEWMGSEGAIYLGNDAGCIGPVYLGAAWSVPPVGAMIELWVAARGEGRLQGERVKVLWEPEANWRGIGSGEGWERLAVDPERWKFLRVRSAVLQALRTYFLRRGFLEVETPILSEYEAFDPHLVNARVMMRLGRSEWQGYLQTSPEYEMKMLMAGGARRIFQFFRAVRADERTNEHNPEFTLLEWYRAGADYRALMKDLEGLVKAAGQASGAMDYLVFRGKRIEMRGRFRVTSFFDALERAIGVGEREAQTVEGLAKAVGREVPPFAGEDWADYVTRVFALKVQPNLGWQGPELIVDYPAALGTMARAKRGRPDLYERVELFIGGVELANGYSELSDAAEQRRRFEEESRKTGKRIPENFLRALEQGIGECAGCALGVDRLVMVLTDAKSISEVMPFAMGESSE